MLRLFTILFVFFSLSCKNVLHIADARQESYRIEAMQDLEPDSEITNLIAPYKEKVEDEISEVLGESAISMIKAQPQSTLGNWMADLMYKKSKDYYGNPFDFAFTNHGGIRIPELPRGPVTRGKIFELMPFENLLVVLEVEGDIVQKLFELMAEDGGWPVSNHIRYLINEGKPQNITINGQPIDPDRTYKIATVDFIANGGGNCFFFRDQPREELGVLFRDAIIQFIQEETAQGKLLDAEMDHRVRIIEE